MATIAKKRKAAGELPEPMKRQRVVPTPSEAQLQSDDEDEYQQSDAGDFSENEQEAETPATPSTPFSPGRKKFPSELKTLRCTYEGCNKSFNRPVRLQTHMTTHTNERTFKCTYTGCDKSYFENKHLQAHIRGSHTHERNYQCDWEGCTKSFATSTRLKRHKDAHQGHDRFRCTAYPPCHETFRKHQTLQRHIRTSHLELAPYPCTYLDPTTKERCKAGFDGAGGLRQHEEREHGAHRYFCLECIVPDAFNPDGSPLNLGFTTNARLQAHMRKEHTNTTCVFCDLKCTTQRELQKHYDIRHSGRSLEDRKNIRCTYIGCDKSFTKKFNLDTHIRTFHKGERYICGDFDVSSTVGLERFMLDEGCGDDFVSKATLEDHIRTAHLKLPSLVNANRKKASSQSDIEYDSDFDSNDPDRKPRKKKRTRKSKVSAIDKLMGEPLIPDNNKNIQMRTRSGYELPGADTLDPNMPDFDDGMTESRFDWSDVDMDIPIADSTLLQTQTLPAANFGGQELIGDIDWELQRRALEGGPFWIGANDSGIQSQDSWAREEMEMRRLIGEEGMRTVYPELE